jgi:hypothetical protein
MADILAANVAYTEVGGVAVRNSPRGGTVRQFDVAFGDGALTYEQDTGIPLTKEKLGCPTVVLNLKVLGRTKTAVGTNYVWEWNKSQTAPALTGFEVRTAQAGPEGLSEIVDDFAIAAQTIRVEVEGY